MRGHPCPFAPTESRQEAYQLNGDVHFQAGLSLACRETLRGSVFHLCGSPEWRQVSAESRQDFSEIESTTAPIIALFPRHLVDLSSAPATATERLVTMRPADRYLVHEETQVRLLWRQSSLRIMVPFHANWADIEPLVRGLLPISPEPLPPVLSPHTCSAVVGVEAIRTPLEQPRAFRRSDADAVLHQQGWWGSPKPDGVRAELIQVALEEDGGGLRFERCMRGREDCLYSRPEFSHGRVQSALASLGDCRLDGELVSADGAMVFVVFQVKQLRGVDISSNEAVEILQQVSALLQGQNWIICKQWARPGPDFAAMASRYNPERGTYRHSVEIEYPIDGWVFQRFTTSSHGEPAAEQPLKFKDTRHLNLDLGIDLEKREAFYYSETGTRVALPGAKWNRHDELRILRRLPCLDGDGDLCCEFARTSMGDWIPQFVRIKRPNAASTVRHTIATLQDHWGEAEFFSRMGGEGGKAGADQERLRYVHYNRIAATGNKENEPPEGHREPYRNYQNWVKLHVIQKAIISPQWNGSEITAARRVLEIGAGKAGDIHKYARCMAALQKRYPTLASSMRWHLSDPGYAGEASALLEEAQRRQKQLRGAGSDLLALDYTPLGIHEALWSAPFSSEASFTNVSAMFALNYALSSEETARLYLQRIHHLLQPGGYLAACITDSDAICSWKRAPLHDLPPRIDIQGAPVKAWGCRYAPTVEGERSGVNGALEEFVIPHEAFIDVARRCGFEVVLDANHADLAPELEDYRRCSEANKRQIQGQMHIPRLYRAIILRRPRGNRKRAPGAAAKPAKPAKKKKKRGKTPCSGNSRRAGTN